MPTNVVIRFEGDSKDARQAISRLEKELKSLSTTTKAANTTTGATEKTLDALGREIHQTAAEARRFNGVFRDSQGRLREANGRYAKTATSVKEIGTELRRSNKSASVFTVGLGELAGSFAALGIADVVAHLASFTTGSINAAAQLEGFNRGLKIIEGSRAPQRLQELIEVANLPV